MNTCGFFSLQVFFLCASMVRMSIRTLADYLLHAHAPGAFYQYGGILQLLLL